jgi:hypothetical protein
LPLLLVPALVLGSACDDTSFEEPTSECASCDSAANPLLTITLSDDGELIPRYSKDLVLPGYLEVSVWATFNEEDSDFVDVRLDFTRKDGSAIPGIGVIPALRTTRKLTPDGVVIDMPLRLSTITLKAKGDEDLPLTVSYQTHARGFTATDGYTSQSVDSEWVDFYHAYKLVATAHEATTYVIVGPRTGDDILTSLDREGSLDWVGLSDRKAYEIGYDTDADRLSVSVLREDEHPAGE